MSEKSRLRGWHLVNDEVWKERLRQIKDGHPETQQPHKDTLPSPVDECKENCPICHGKGFTIDPVHENAIECPNARRRARGGD